MIFRFMQYLIDKHTKTVEGKIRKTIYETVPKDHEIMIGDWDCDESPFGVCAYDLDEDSCCDHCIYCGEPDERK